MEKYPTIKFIVRFGRVIAWVVPFIIAVVFILIGWKFLGWPVLLVGIIIGTLTYALAMSYVELVTLITDILVPQ